MKRLLTIVLFFPALYASHCSFDRQFKDEPFEVALAAPSSFGRTHFIVGHQEAAPDLALGSPEIKVKTPSIRAYFSPDDDVRKQLVELIDREQKKIQAAVYIITEPSIAQALLRAKKRNVSVELVTDVGCLRERGNKVSVLCEKGCRLFVYNPPQVKNGNSLMHHKFALFYGPQTVWTGSFNFTNAASKRNQENAVVINDADTFNKFSYQFKRLKDRSHRYGNHGRA